MASRTGARAWTGNNLSQGLAIWVGTRQEELPFRAPRPARRRGSRGRSKCWKPTGWKRRTSPLQTIHPPTWAGMCLQLLRQNRSGRLQARFFGPDALASHSCDCAYCKLYSKPSARPDWWQSPVWLAEHSSPTCLGRLFACGDDDTTRRNMTQTPGVRGIDQPMCGMRCPLNHQICTRRRSDPAVAKRVHSILARQQPAATAHSVQQPPFLTNAVPRTQCSQKQNHREASLRSCQRQPLARTRRWRFRQPSGARLRQPSGGVHAWTQLEPGCGSGAGDSSAQRRPSGVASAN